MTKRTHLQPTVRSDEQEKSSTHKRNRTPVTEIIHNDDTFILVNKPAGVAIESGFEDQPGVIEQLVANSIIADSDEPLHCVYPVDLDASGLLLLCRTTELAGRLESQLADGTLDVCQLAIVRCPVFQPSGMIDRRITERGRGGLAYIDERHGRTAITQWRRADSFIGFALLECRPRTTVRHQVRVHLESAGMPLAVDPTYGGADRLMLSSFKTGYRRSHRRPEHPLIRRLTLHAASITLEHPTTGKKLQFDALPPKDFRAALHQLAKYGRLPPTSKR